MGARVDVQSGGVTAVATVRYGRDTGGRRCSKLILSSSKQPEVDYCAGRGVTVGLVKEAVLVRRRPCTAFTTKSEIRYGM